MGFLSNILKATVETVLTPVAIIKDTVDVLSGESPETTTDLIESIVENLGDATDDLVNGNL